MAVYYLGIDPGQSGGLAVIDGKGRSITAVKMPATDMDLWETIAEYSEFPIAFAWLEKVAAMPNPATGKRMGVTSAFNFGQSYGFLRGALTGAKIPHDLIPPRSWQKVLGITPRNKDKESPTDFKNRNKAMAQRFFPKMTMIHAIADAHLIAEACRRSRRNRVRL